MTKPIRIAGAFGDKRQLFVRVFNDYCDEMVASARTALEGPDAEAHSRLCAMCGQSRSPSPTTQNCTGACWPRPPRNWPALIQALIRSSARAQRTFQELSEVIVG